MKKSELFFNVILLPIDYIALVVAAVGAYFLRFRSLADYRPVVYEMPFGEFFSITLAVALGWVILFAISGMYAMQGTRRVLDEIGRTFFACAAGVLLIIVLIFFQRDFFSSRFIILAAGVLAFVLVGLARMIMLMVQRWMYHWGLGVHRLVIIGADRATQELVTTFERRKSLGMKVIREFPHFDEAAEAAIDRLWQDDLIDEVLLGDPAMSKNTNVKLIEFAQERHLGFRYVADLFKTYAIRTELTTIAGIPLVEVKPTLLDGWGRVIKRIVDILGALIFLIVLSPVFLVTTIAIAIDSRGPIFFSRRDDDSPVTRVGQGGKSFRYRKFRSMRPNTDSLRLSSALQEKNLREGSPLTKFEDDPRITRVGRFIRRFSIDELPELVLVLLGRMSLVGPRPHLPDEVAKYQKHHKRVLTIKPGMTGMAQVSGRSDLDFEEEVRLDIYYIENWSLALDLQILFKTPFVLFRKRKAL